MVTRRLYRDGSSEYLLNGVPSRLRDVVEFFLGTGVGSKAYAIIEQGRIGFIVSSRPEDRRGLIDEAAGITRYKSKKKAAERRMDSTRQHLLRVSDIIGEIDGRLRSLRLQAQKAERYKRYKSELKDLDLWSSAQRYLGHLAEEKSLGDGAGGVRDSHEIGGDGAGGGARRRPRPSGWRSAEEAHGAGGGEGRAVRAVEQGAARHAARQPPRRGGDGAGGAGRGGAARDRRAARAGSGTGRQHRGDRGASWPRSTRRPTRASANTRRRRACRTSGAPSWRRRAHELEAAQAEIVGRAREHRAAGGGARGRAAAARRSDGARRERGRRGDGGGRAAGRAGRRGAAPARGDRRRSRAKVDGGARAGGRRRSAAGGRARRAVARRAGAGDAARGGAPPALAAGVADGDPGSLRALPEGRSRDHAGAPRGGRRQRRHQGRRRRHRAAAPGAGDRRRGGAGRAAGQRHRRLARGGRRGDPVPQAEARGAIVVHSRGRCGAHAARGEVVYDATARASMRPRRRRRRTFMPAVDTMRSPPHGRRATACAGRCSS